MTPLALGLGYGIDLLLGDPVWLPHPVVGFGKMISAGERRLNHGSARARFAKGALLALGLVALVAAGVWALLAAARYVHPALAIGLEVAGVFYGLANRTLITEGRAVFRQLEVGLAEGRRQLARIVGRDTAHLAHEPKEQVRGAFCPSFVHEARERECVGVWDCVPVCVDWHLCAHCCIVTTV
jgi:adenosylcobinamide-phosphate synthase